MYQLVCLLTVQKLPAANYFWILVPAALSPENGSIAFEQIATYVPPT